jgi:hypothetical protein
MKWVYLFIMLVFSTSCFAQIGSISCLVVDSNDNPLQNIQAVAHQAGKVIGVATSDNAGFINMKSLPAGRYHLGVIFSNDTAIVLNLIVSPDRTTTFKVSSNQAGRLIEYRIGYSVSVIDYEKLSIDLSKANVAIQIVNEFNEPIDADMSIDREYADMDELSNHHPIVYRSASKKGFFNFYLSRGIYTLRIGSTGCRPGTRREIITRKVKIADKPFEATFRVKECKE